MSRRSRLYHQIPGLNRPQVRLLAPSDLLEERVSAWVEVTEGSLKEDLLIQFENLIENLGL